MSRRYREGGRFSLGGSLSTVVRLLIAWNVIFFLVQLLAGRFVRGLDLAILYTLGLVPQSLFHGQIWQLITYMFLHGSFFHVAFNMLALWMFGSDLEYLWGPRRFLIYYFFTGIGAGITNAIFDPHSAVPIVGASGAIYGLLLAFGMYFPNRPILIYFLFPMPAKYFVILFGAVEFFAALVTTPIASPAYDVLLKGMASHTAGVIPGRNFTARPGPIRPTRIEPEGVKTSVLTRVDLEVFRISPAIP